MSVLTPEEKKTLLEEQEASGPVRIMFRRQIADDQFRWRNHPAIHAWTRQNGLLSPTDHERWLERIEADPAIEMFGVLGAKGSQMLKEVGTAGLTSLNLLHGTAEFSLLIGPEHQGQGFGKLALQELLRYGFKNLPLRCIWGETFEGNPALKLFEKIGFTLEGRLRKRYFKEGRAIDALALSLLREEAETKPWF